MKIAMCDWGRQGGTFDGPVVEECDDGSILIAARAKGPRWIPGTLLRVKPQHIKGYSEQEISTAADRRAALKGATP